MPDGGSTTELENHVKKIGEKLDRLVDIAEVLVERVKEKNESVSSLERRVKALEERAMQRVETGNISVWDIKDDGDWTKETANDGRTRRWRRRVNFAQWFNEVPTVQAVIRGAGLGSTTLTEIYVGPDSIDRHGFTIQFWAVDDSRVCNMAGAWIAVGK